MIRRPANLALVLAIGLASVAGCKCYTPPAKESLRAEGAACTEDEQCETGMCESVKGADRICLRTCITGCRALEVCTKLADERYGCVPELAGLCKPCQADADCPYPGDRCITLGAETFCGRDCSFDEGCPSSYRCADATGVGGNAAVKQCQPQSGTCACTTISAGQSVPCQVTNTSGTCLGQRICSPPEGYGSCTARTPTAETCNNIDDDCNGQVDENLGDITCGLGTCLRSAAACANGSPQTCTAGTPELERCDGLDNDCDGAADNGFDKQNDVGHCGGCNNACVITNAVPRCELGVCQIDRCLAGWVDRDGVKANGCEYPCSVTNGGTEICDGLDNDCNGIVDDGFNLTSDPSNCGTCNLVCQGGGGTVATFACVARVCAIGTCVMGRGDCNQQYPDGCETDTNTSVAHCGACAQPCVTANATPVCTAGRCGIGACLPGYRNCNNDVSDGCEINTTNDVANCGACGTVCSFPNAAPACSAGTCTFTCLPNWWNADNNQANGCEYACVRTNNGVEACDNIDNDCDGLVDEDFTLATDVNHCGLCNRACAAPFVSQHFCSAGNCGITTCATGRADCNLNYVDGCEVDTTSALAHCGGCNLACAPANATPSCSASTCGIQSCNVGFRNCNNDVTDGCEINVTSSLAHCGACNANCTRPNAVPQCLAGSCSTAACLPGYWNLDGVDLNGCEYACTITNGGTEICDGLDNNCNGTADEGFNLQTNPLHCGACNFACTAPNVATYACTTGNCGVATCTAPFRNCDGAFANGCETNSNTSLAHCGACNAACTTPNATPVCSTGSCQVQSCNVGFRNCNGTVSDGCEININTSPTNCGGCGTVCSFPNAVPSCAAGACAFTCQPNFWDLDGVAANGCEYACTFQSATDLPDLAFVDANCDGIDGEWNNAVFVAPPASGGSDANPGTRTLPKATIGAGMSAAVTTARRDVYVATGAYLGQVTMSANKGLYGAYAPGTWARSATNVVSVSGSVTPLVISSASNTTVQWMTFNGANATAVGSSSYGALVANSSNVALQRVTLVAGSGAAGTNGSNGTPGANGLAGAGGIQGCEDSGGFCASCGQPQGGAGGTNASCTSANGGRGGNAGNGGSAGVAGSNSAAGTLGGPGTPAGQGNWNTPVQYNGLTGLPGALGTNGAPGASLGTFSAAGYIAALTFDGTNGAHGRGGGGGGGGGGGTTSCDSYGGSGSGGGAGGCAGTFATRGLSGGASIGLYLYNATVGATNCSITSGNGGGGGNGGSGGTGGFGGGGGARNPYGGSGEQDDGSNGARGGSGGQGGRGGHGSAGGGGPTVGVLRASGSTYSGTGTSVTIGTPGAGGTSVGGNGAVGLSAATY